MSTVNHRWPWCAAIAALVWSIASCAATTSVEGQRGAIAGASLDTAAMARPDPHRPSTSGARFAFTGDGTGAFLGDSLTLIVVLEDGRSSRRVVLTKERPWISPVYSTPTTGTLRVAAYLIGGANRGGPADTAAIVRSEVPLRDSLVWNVSLETTKAQPAGRLDLRMNQGWRIATTAIRDGTLQIGADSLRLSFHPTRLGGGTLVLP